MPVSIHQLRESLKAIEDREGAPRPSLPFGVTELDTRLATGGLRIDALHEVAGATAGFGDDAAATLFLAGIAARSKGPVLWVVRRRDLFAPGLFQAGLAPERLLYAEARDDAELLALIEEGLRHRGLGAVIGEAKKASMPATRRLQLAAEDGPTIALLLRRHGKDGDDPLEIPSAAVTRWRIASAPSTPLPVEGVGRARWRLSMIRQRGGAPFDMEMEACDETGRLALPAGMGSGAAQTPDRADRAAA